MKKSLFAAIIAAVLTALCAGEVVSQDEGADTMQILREKVRTDKKLLVSMNMNLTDTEARAFWPVYEDYQEALGKLADRTIKLVDDYSGQFQNLSEKEAKKIIDEYLAIEADRQNLRQAYLPLFRKALSYKKTARYYQIENKIQAVLNYEIASRIPLIE